jgi:hypothetical protein
MAAISHDQYEWSARVLTVLAHALHGVSASARENVSITTMRS